MEENIQKILLEELKAYFDPLLGIGQDPESAIDFFYELGWDIESLLGDSISEFHNTIKSISEVVQTIEELANGEVASLEKLKEVLIQTSNVVNTVKGLSSLTISGTVQPQELPIDLLNALTILYIQKKSPFLFGLLKFLTIVKGKEEQAYAINGQLVRTKNQMLVIDWQTIPEILTNPKKVFKSYYYQNGFDDLETANEVARSIFTNVALMLMPLGIQCLVGRGTGPEVLQPEIEARLKGMLTFKRDFQATEKGKVSIGATLGIIPGNEGGPAVLMEPFGEAEFVIPVSNKLAFAFQMLTSPAAVKIYDNKFEIITTGNTSSVQINFTFFPISETGASYLLGSTTGTRFEISKIQIDGSIILENSRQEYKAIAGLKNCAIVIAPTEGDSFLQKMLGNTSLRTDFDLAFGWSNLAGFIFEGSGGLEIRLPTHITVGPLEFLSSTISVKPRNGEIPIEVGSTIKATLGPLVILTENIGLTSSVTFPSSGGNLGPINLDIGFKPPNGVGIVVNAAVVKGGGFLSFDFDKQEYSGALQLSVSDFLSLSAIGLITTRMPDGSPGFSMLLIITAQFSPAFQLGYGFTLSGVGGLIGLNRTMLLEPLRDGVRSGAINGIMFPTNVIENAPRIISDLKAIFPPLEGHFLIGPMATIGWGTPTIITLSLGVIIELPDPKIAILGVLRMVLPKEDQPILNLQVNFVGTIDPANKLITFDASLFDSNLLQTMTLEGDMAARLKWGDTPDLIISVGGFHPAYQPTMPMPALRRLSITILDEENARIRLEAYFAITSNTAQFGVKSDLYFGLEGFTISGTLQFDTLFHFSPFTFEATCSGNFTLEAKVIVDEIYAVININAKINGPAPWKAYVTGEVTVFGLPPFKADRQLTWGDEAAETALEINLEEEFKKVLSQPESWHTALPLNRVQLVTIRNPDVSVNAIDRAAADKPKPLRLHPFGTLVISQRLLPLNLPLDKYGNATINGNNNFSIHSVVVGTVVGSSSFIKDKFARANYKHMSDDEKLAARSYEDFDSGVKVDFSSNSSSFSMGNVVRHNVEYEQKIIDKEPVKVETLRIVTNFSNLLQGAAVKRSSLSEHYRKVTRSPVVGTPPKEPSSSFTIMNGFTNAPLNQGITYASRTEAMDALSGLIATNEAFTGMLHIDEQIA